MHLLSIFVLAAIRLQCSDAVGFEIFEIGDNNRVEIGGFQLRCCYDYSAKMKYIGTKGQRMTVMFTEVDVPDKSVFLFLDSGDKPLLQQPLIVESGTAPDVEYVFNQSVVKLVFKPAIHFSSSDAGFTAIVTTTGDSKQLITTSHKRRRRDEDGCEGYFKKKCMDGSCVEIGEYCPEEQCAFNERRCDGTICVHNDLRCPGQPCPYRYSFPCADDSQCVFSDDVCDGKSDCADGSDEHDGCNNGLSAGTKVFIVIIAVIVVIGGIFVVIMKNNQGNAPSVPREGARLWSESAAVNNRDTPVIPYTCEPPNVNQSVAWSRNDNTVDIPSARQSAPPADTSGPPNYHRAINESQPVNREIEAPPPSYEVATHGSNAAIYNPHLAGS